MKEIAVTVLPINGWQTWVLNVADDAPEDPEQLTEWVRENLGSNDCQIWELADSGDDGWAIESVEVLNNPAPVEKNLLDILTESVVE